MPQEEEIKKEDIKKIISGLNKYAVPIIVICLFYLFYQLGFMIGFNQSFHLQEDYYEEKISRYCVCQETPHYNIPDIELNLEELNLNLSKNKNKKEI